MIRFLKEPLVHFLSLGLLLFLADAGLRSPSSATVSEKVITIDRAALERLRDGYQRQFGQAPDEETLRGLITAHVREEVLYREALTLGLDRGDSIVRRRLAQKMEFLTADILVSADPDESELRRYFDLNASRYAGPVRYTFRHVYFSLDRRGPKGESLAKEALQALGRGADDDSLGDAFLHGFDFAQRGADDLQSLFGDGFVEGLAKAPQDVWSGPIASTYGFHLVRLTARSEPRLPRLEEVREVVLRDFNEERRRQSNEQIFGDLRRRYTVSVDESAIQEVAAPGVRTAQLAR